MLTGWCHHFICSSKKGECRLFISGHNAHLRSLHQYMENAPHPYAVRVWSQPFSLDKVNTPSGKEILLINLPFYYLGMLNTILDSVFEK